jgi:hypothetical protein
MPGTTHHSIGMGEASVCKYTISVYILGYDVTEARVIIDGKETNVNLPEVGKGDPIGIGISPSFGIFIQLAGKIGELLLLVLFE